MADKNITRNTTITSYDNARAALAVKVSRSALGYNQEEFAKCLKTSKPTIARIETLEVPVGFNLYARLVRFMAEKGVYIDAIDSVGVAINIKEDGVTNMVDRLCDDANRRSDWNTRRPKK